MRGGAATSDDDREHPVTTRTVKITKVSALGAGHATTLRRMARTMARGAARRPRIHELSATSGHGGAMPISALRALYPGFGGTGTGTGTCPDGVRFRRAPIVWLPCGAVGTSTCSRSRLLAVVLTDLLSDSAEMRLDPAHHGKPLNRHVADDRLAFVVVRTGDAKGIM